MSEDVLISVLEYFCETGTKLCAIETRIENLQANSSFGSIIQNFTIGLTEFIQHFRASVVRLMNRNPTLLEVRLRSDKLCEQVKVIHNLCRFELSVSKNCFILCLFACFYQCTRCPLFSNPQAFGGSREKNGLFFFSLSLNFFTFTRRSRKIKLG